MGRNKSTPKKKSRTSASPSVRSGRSPTRKTQVSTTYPLSSLDVEEKLQNLSQESEWCVSNSDSEFNGIVANVNTLQSLKLPQGSLVILYPSLIMDDNKTNQDQRSNTKNKLPTITVPIFISKECKTSSKIQKKNQTFLF